jgi:hypothetical protein
VLELEIDYRCDDEKKVGELGGDIGAIRYPPITYSWTGLLILDHSYLVGNLTNSKIAETKALEPLKS